jgi:hypothetical protein
MVIKFLISLNHQSATKNHEAWLSRSHWLGGQHLNEPKSKFFGNRLQFIAACEAGAGAGSARRCLRIRLRKPGFAVFATLYSHIANYQFGDSCVGSPLKNCRIHSCRGHPCLPARPNDEF